MAPLNSWHIYLLSWKSVPQQSKWDLGKNFFLYILRAQNVLTIWDSFPTSNEIFKISERPKYLYINVTRKLSK